jgi:hypothetical protein
MKFFPRGSGIAHAIVNFMNALQAEKRLEGFATECFKRLLDSGRFIETSYKLHTSFKISTRLEDGSGCTTSGSEAR